MKKTVLILTLLFIAGLFAQPVLAESKNSKDQPWETFNFQLGWYFADLDSDIRIGSDTLGVGVTADVEETLGLKTSMSVFKASTLYRFSDNRRHQVDFQYFDLRRNSTKQIGTQIDWGDHTYPIGTTVESYFNIRVFKGSYSYAFFQDDRFRLSASLGLYTMPIEMGISADGIGAEEKDFIAPLPVLGFKFDFALTPKLFLKQSFEVFYYEYKQFEGSIATASLDLEYNVWKHVGLGIGVDTFRLKIEADGEDYPEIDFIGNLEFNYIGLLLYTKVYF